MNKLQKFGRLKALDTKTHRFQAIASSKTVDRDGDVILPTAFLGRIETFKRNPVMTWAHDQRRPTVGKVVDFQVTEEDFIFEGEFASEASPFAKEIEALYAGGFLNAFSVGFMPHQFSKDPVMPGQSGMTFTDVELLEIACVPVPSNREALVKGLALMDAPELAQVHIDREWDRAGAMDRLRAYHQPAAGFAMPCNDDRKLWELALPHHDLVDGQPVAVFRGVLDALMTLNGARGAYLVGTAEERAAAYAHLAEHMKAWGRDLPPIQAGKLLIGPAEQAALRDYHVTMAQMHGLKISVEPTPAKDPGAAGAALQKALEDLGTTIKESGNRAVEAVRKGTRGVLLPA